MKVKKQKIPQIGMRTLKSALGVFLGFVIYYLRGKQGTPFYTALSVLWCMRPYMKDSKQMAFQRAIGTFIGGAYGLIMIMFEKHIFEPTDFLRYCAIAIMIIPIIHTTIILNKKNASYFACVVFLSIVVNHLTDENPYLFVMNRVLDTLIGIFLALAINMFRLPQKYNRDTLFVSGMDETLLSLQETITPYSQVHLNRMLDEGAKFTVATMRTTATLIENLQGIRIQLPVIAMDGAVLFDMKQKKYIHKIEMDYNEVQKLVKLLQEQNIHVFQNVILEDSWMIYYDEFHNEAEVAIYEKLRISPYRNYIKTKVPEGQKILYLMSIDRTEKVSKIYKLLQQLGFHKNYKIVTYESTDYPGFSYLKIYHKDATRSNMIADLANRIDAKEIVTFGSIDGKSDIIIKDSDNNEMVKILRKLFVKK